ncbi:MAG TPA: [FeFe] hydrogenase H-cluster radical SAM maturase HydE [Tepidisphaeraceae bacterium]|nr:[FeFe] hydrogenase H-cluster radical SAM maturase HydE [Tepidisphaeraceae bacterium]
MSNVQLEREQILRWLREEDPGRLEELWTLADRVREEWVGPAVHLRALVEISNHCVRQCAYCGLRAGNGDLDRYRMSGEEIIACAHRAVALGYGTIVMQAGEDYGIRTTWLTDIIRQIKSETSLAVTLSLGERPESDLTAWRAAGADRYLLRFETSEPRLFSIIHPPLPHQTCDRIAILRQLRQLGYEVGSGIMVGIPGQTYDTVADDIELFRELDLDMIGIGPYIAHPITPLGNRQITFGVPEYEQVPNTELMVYKAVALTRLVCPEANIPSTTALATINKTNGRELGLQRGANVVMPNLTPPQYRALYQIYPGKACVTETGEACSACLRHRIESIRREIGAGPGGRRRAAV